MIRLKDILSEADVFGNGPTTSTDMPELEDAFGDLEKDIKRTDIDAPESEAIGLTLAGVALSLPEIIKLWAEKKVKSDSNHFKNIESYTLSKSLFNDKSVTEKVEVIEKLINLLTDCANGKMRVTQIEKVIDNLY